MSSEAPTPKTKKTTYTPEEIAKAENNYQETYPAGTFIWLDDPDYQPLTKKTKRKIHELRAAEYKDRPEVFKNTLGKHAEGCIESIERYKNKSAAADTPGPGPAAPDSSAVEEPGPQGKQMKNPFVV